MTKKQKYTVVDLFSGCGGISEGFASTGRVDIIGAIDFDQVACDTFKLNFPKTKVICGDINDISVESTGFKNVDILVGGPPCQGFSRLNYWDKDRDNDPRNKLFYQYLRFVEELKPKAVLIENVKNILVAKDGFAPQAITSILSSLGYNVSYSIVCAADFGVPQMRERAIFIALKKEYGTFDFSSLDKYKSPQVSVYDAISDIADIEESAKLQKPGSVFELGKATSMYQREMRRKDGLLYNHLIYYPNDSVQQKISYVPQGGNWRSVPKELFPSERSNRYTNYLRRLDYSMPSITIDTGHRVYFHPVFNRVPTVRESARIQSFPDSFIFTGAKGQQLKQVGNAVPPLMANALAKAIIDTLENKQIKQYKILDLFCGAGGLSLGFEKAGFSVVKAVDIDPWAINTYNFNREDKVAEVMDVTAMTKEYLNSLGPIDGIIGGPPCQGFSIANGQRIINDERNKLYREYFRILEETRPKFFIIENVTGILTLAKGVVKDDILQRAKKLGYKVEFKTVNASLYGVPQVRLRVIFVGIHESCTSDRFVFPEGNSEPVSIEDAIGDLPSLDNGEDNTIYVHPPKTDYQRMIRDGMTVLHNHILSIHTEKTKQTIAMIPEGKRVCDLPEELRGGRKYEALLRKMDRKKPAVTIDTGHRTYFHYQELRIPSTREVARLQSFPDSYVFTGPRNDQQKQVGNAVPPMLAQRIAEAIYKHISKE